MLVDSDPHALDRFKEKEKQREAREATSKPSESTPSSAPTPDESATDRTEPAQDEHAASHEDEFELPPPPQERPTKRISWFWNEIRVLFTIANVMYLLGALIVAGAMTFFMTKGIDCMELIS